MRGFVGIARIILVHRIRGTAWIVMIDGIQGILRIVGVDRVQRSIGLISVDRIEDVVVALVLRIESLFGKRRCKGEEPW